MITSNDRVAFEKWADEQGYELGRRAVPYTSSENRNGDYQSRTTQVSWLAWEACSEMRSVETTDCTIGVGDGSGNLFVHGSYDAVKRIQSMFLELTRLTEALRNVRDHGCNECMECAVAINRLLGSPVEPTRIESGTPQGEAGDRAGPLVSPLSPEKASGKHDSSCVYYYGKPCDCGAENGSEANKGE